MWYTEGFSNYVTCSGGEDPTCADSVDPFDYSIDDHLTYMSLPISNDC